MRGELNKTEGNEEKPVQLLKITISDMASSTPLAPSLSSLRTSTTLLSSSIDILSTATQDLPRLRTVLSQTRHYELTPSSELAAAQSAVLSELKPEVERLLERVEKVVEARERREEWLRARWALGEGRLGRETGVASAALRERAAKVEQQAAEGAYVGDVKAKRVRQKKERLSYAVERLQLQATQKERQLRMSMAAQEAAGSSSSAPEKREEDEF